MNSWRLPWNWIPYTLRGKKKRVAIKKRSLLSPYPIPQGSSSKRPHHKNNKKGKKSQASKDKPHASLLNKDNKLIGSEKERRIKECLSTYCGGKHPIEKCFKRP
ncbi:hypothetical protein O181_011612 [Austropuccinia psidii MF-1]|uniref:Uncharacterized protein n=1 Tax=Austropuccinia psidii MF-1 TaxID=1389203 RepID=A0A9Q3GM90_9BASI|nr:hypothetical protein [Austropuccinia psidii MF-1]